MNSVRALSTATSDGWILRGELAQEGSTSHPVVILLHAMMASRRTMDRPRGSGLGSVLAARGFGVVSFDLRGHGESGPSARDGARYDYDDYVLHDAPAITAFARQTFPNRKIVIAGHSLGAHVTLAAAGVFPDKSPDAIVSIAGNMWRPSFEPDQINRVKKTAMLAAFVKAAETFGYFDPRPLRMGTDAVALPYVRQFWRMWSADRYGSNDGKHDYSEAVARIAVPILSIASSGDTLFANPKSVELFFAATAPQYKTLRVFTDRDTGEPAPDHMGLVTNPRSVVIWNQIANWIEKLS